MVPACPRNGNAIPNPSSLADVVQAINYGLFIDGSHPPAASEMLATSQATLVDTENGVDALRGPLGRSPSTQRTDCPNFSAARSFSATVSGGLFRNGDWHQLLQYQQLKCSPENLIAAALAF